MKVIKIEYCSDCPHNDDLVIRGHGKDIKVYLFCNRLKKVLDEMVERREDGIPKDCPLDDA
jgi:hypothetical protein